MITTFCCLVTISTYSQTPCTSIMMAYSSWMLDSILCHWAQIAQISIIETSNKQYGSACLTNLSSIKYWYHVTEWSIYMQDFAVQILIRYEQFLTRHGFISLSSGPTTTCGIGAISSFCTSQSETVSSLILGTYLMTFGTSGYIKIHQDIYLVLLNRLRM